MVIYSNSFDKYYYQICYIIIDSRQTSMGYVMGGRINLKEKELILIKYERIGMPITLCEGFEIRKTKL